MTNNAMKIILGAALALNVFGAATVQVYNADLPGEGFNDPTAATPVGGNTGTTVGAQRQIAFQFAANRWGSTLTSSQIVRVIASITSLPCAADSAVLGGAAPYSFYSDVPGLRSNTWYPAALAEKLAKSDLGAEFPDDNFEIFALFNGQLGQPDCLTGSGWYYGLDTNTPAGQINFVTVLLHELGHGFGFTVDPTDGSTGERALDIPSVWERYVTDATTRKTWLDLNAADRAASAVKTNNLVWSGPYTTLYAYQVLDFRYEVVVWGPGPPKGDFEAQQAAFGPLPNFFGITDVVVPVTDTGGASATDGCEELTAESRRAVSGKIALMDRGNCLFTVKVKNAQLAGAVGALIANNVAVGLPGMAGADPTITIPSLGITQSLGNALRSRHAHVGPLATMHQSFVTKAGTTNGFVRLYAPDPYEQGSSVSHWDTSLTPNQLMEPFINDDLTFALKPPKDLTYSLLQDIGW